MLSGTRNAVLRDWALEQLRARNKDDYMSAFEFLAINAVASDRPLLAKALYDIRRYDVWFDYCAMEVRHLECRPSVELLQIIYEYGRCAFCRSFVVKELAKRRALTLGQIEECVEDADEDTRKFAVRSMRSRRKQSVS